VEYIRNPVHLRTRFLYLLLNNLDQVSYRKSCRYDHSQHLETLMLGKRVRKGERKGKERGERKRERGRKRKKEKEEKEEKEKQKGGGKEKRRRKRKRKRENKLDKIEIDER
jgi:hypothetical protein